MYILILNCERVGMGAGRQDTEGGIGAEYGSNGRKSTRAKPDAWEGKSSKPNLESRRDDSLPTPSLPLNSRLDSSLHKWLKWPRSTVVSHLGLVPVVVRLSIGCRKLVYKFHPDLFVTSGSMHQHGRNSMVSIILLVISEVRIL